MPYGCTSAAQVADILVVVIAPLVLVAPIVSVDLQLPCTRYLVVSCLSSCTLMSRALS